MKQGDIPSLVERLRGPVQWGYMCLADGGFIADDTPLEAADALDALSQPKDAVGGGVPAGMVARERIARIIDPEAWTDPAKSDADYDRTPYRERSLAKADAILAALPTSDASERLRGALEPFLREIDRLEREYGFDRPPHQGQTLILPLSDLVILRDTALAALSNNEVSDAR